MSETILMIHGMMSGGWHWDNYKNFFRERGYNCIAPTLRFHDMKPGDMPDPKLGTTSLLDYVDDIEKEIKKEIKKLNHMPILIGHSM